MNRYCVQSRQSGQLYEVQYLVHPAPNAPIGTVDVYACYRLSAYDGMPIGSLVWLSADDMIEADAQRLKTLPIKVQS